MSAVKHTPVVIDLDGVTVMTDHKHGHHTICRSASPDSAAFIVQAVNSHYALIEALEKIAARKWDTMTQGCDAASEAAKVARATLSLAKGEQG